MQAGTDRQPRDVHGLRQGVRPAFYDELAAQQQPRLVAGAQGPLRGRGAAADGGAARGRRRRVRRGQAVPSEPRHPLLEGQVALQDQHRRGDLPGAAAGPCTCRSPPRGCTSAAAGTTSTVPSSPATGRPSPTTVTGPRARADRRRPAAAKADVTAHGELKTGAAGLHRRPPAHRPPPQGRHHRDLGPRRQGLAAHARGRGRRSWRAGGARSR